MGGGHLQLRAQGGDRAAQFVRGVGDEPPLPLHGRLQRGERDIGGTGQAGDLVVRRRFGHAPGEILGGGDRRHLPPDALHRTQRAPGDQPGHAADHAEQDGQADEHPGQRGVHGAVLGGERSARVDGQASTVGGPHVHGGETVVLGVAVDRRGAVAEGAVAGDLSHLQGLARVVVIVVAGVVRVVGVGGVVGVVVIVGRGGGSRRTGRHLGCRGAGDPFQVLGGRDHRAVLGDDLHRPVLGVQPGEPVVRRPGGEFGGHRPRRAVRLGARLPDQVRAQRQQHRRARRDQGHRDDEGGTERRLGAHRSEHPAHGAVSSR